MHDKDIEEHAVAGSEKQRREYLKVFEGELWIRYDDHERERTEARKHGEGACKHVLREQREQIFDMLTWRNKLMAVLRYAGFQNITRRGGKTASMKEWALEIANRRDEISLYTGDTFEEVVNGAYVGLVETGEIDE